MKDNIIRSFDKTKQCNSLLKFAADHLTIRSVKGTRLIARGAGLSYCNASAVERGQSLDVTKLNNIISFNETEGHIIVQAGISIGTLNNFLVEKKWQLPVMPGYPAITIGGCIAFNVHGKSQAKVGFFMDWIEEILLFHPDKGELICSKNSNSEIFHLTIGGFGLTGIVIQAKLKLKKIDGNLMEIRSVRIKNINEGIRIMQDEEPNNEYIYSWNNFNLNSRSFGKGVVYLEKIKQGFLENIKPIHYKNKLNVNAPFPSLLNKFTIPLMCQFYYQSSKLHSTLATKSLYESSFPIYGKEIYFHLFGRTGFREYQVLFDFNEWPSAVNKIQRLILDKKMPISLASLKIFRGETHNISFSGSGICLAIDVPNDKNALAFFDVLDEITIEHKGLINLSKDSRASHDLISRTYAGYEDFKHKINGYDPKRIFVSELRERIKV
jgi:decaprenylphospho-beta-D-ribofuranose 2-oxidase